MPSIDKNESTPLDSLIHRQPTGTTWQNLNFPERIDQQLIEIVNRVANRTCGLPGNLPPNLANDSKGTLVLFAGPSGTGKTVTAQVLAKSLGVELWRMDLSAIVSKYIGETEKNLRRVFEDAAASAAILLLDEAEALFGKRSGVRDAHDRYANLDVNYLLQRIEDHKGLVILTSDRREHFDPKFLHRFDQIVEFARPCPAA